MKSSAYPKNMAVRRNRDASLTSTLVTALFERFDDQGLRYCLLRNFEGLPDTIEGDIDVLVGPEDIRRAEMVVRSLSTEFSLLIRSIERNGHLLVHLVLTEEVRRAVDDDRPADGVVLDFQIQLQWMGMHYMDTEGILSEREKYRDSYYVAAPRHMASHLICHALLDKRFIKKAYKEKIEQLVSEGGRDAFAPLTSFFGESMVGRLYTWFRRGETDRIQGIRRSLVLNLIIHGDRSILSAVDFLRKKYLRIARAMLFPPGVLVATAGPDGVGKSTLLTRLKTVLSETNAPIQEQYMGWGRGILPTKRLMAHIRNITAGRKAKLASIPGSRLETSATGLQVLSDVHYFLDLWARYLLQIRPALMRGGMVLCDRYFYDILAKDVWIAKTPFARSILFAMIPKPAVTIIFVGDPEAIVTRKKEMSSCETARQLAEFSRLRPRIGESLELDALNPLNESVESAVTAVIRRSMGYCIT